MHRERLLAACGFALVALVFFAPAFFAGRVFFPLHPEEQEPWRSDVPPERLQADEASDDPALSDKLYLIYPDTTLVVDQWRAGRLPTWNPSILGGVPLLGQALYGTLYPPNLLL